MCMCMHAVAVKVDNIRNVYTVVYQSTVMVSIETFLFFLLSVIKIISISVKFPALRTVRCRAGGANV